MPLNQTGKLAVEARTLIVKHMPSELTFEDRQELLKLFGAKSVKCMSDNSKMKYCAFATFESHDEALSALSKLHQLEILNRKLVVEFAKEQHRSDYPHESDFTPLKHAPVEEPSKKMTEKEKLHQEIDKFSKTLHGVCPSLNLDYIPSPLLKYKYPPPTPSIIANISHALVAVPKFYTQVLHLMNKMNLPAPFGPVTLAPPLAPDSTAMEFYDNQVSNIKNSTQTDEMDTQSSEESELESEEDDYQKQDILPIKRPLNKTKKHHHKRPKFQQFMTAGMPSATTGPRTEPTDIFEALQLDSQKKIQFNINPVLVSDKSNDPEKYEGGFGVIRASKPAEEGTDKNLELGTDSWDDSKFISLSELKQKRVSPREMKTLSVYKNYDPGEPTVRLYIKNLAKQVEEKDLRYIFGRFVNISSESDRNMFDVRLMKEGRMKGQAFVTLASEKQAIEAVNETNGFLLHTKPLVVQFARSAKPKEVPVKQNKK